MNIRKILLAVVAIALLTALFEWLLPQQSLTFWSPLAFALILLFATFYFKIPNFFPYGPPYEPRLEKRLLRTGIALMTGAVIWFFGAGTIVGGVSWLGPNMRGIIIVAPALLFFLVGGVLVNSVVLSRRRPPE